MKNTLPPSFRREKYSQFDRGSLYVADMEERKRRRRDPSPARYYFEPFKLASPT